MKKLLSTIALVCTCIILQSCCVPYMGSYQPVSKNKTISPFLLSEFAKAKKYKGNLKIGYSKKETSLSLSKNTISLFKLECLGLLDFIGITTPGRNWKKSHTELTEWFDAMGIPLKPVER